MPSRRSRHALALAVTLSSLLAPTSAARAQGPGDDALEDDAVHGELVRPDAELITVGPRLPAPDPREIRQRARWERQGRLDGPGRLRLARLLAARAQRRLVRAFEVEERRFDARARGDDSAVERLGAEAARWRRLARADHLRALALSAAVPESAPRPVLFEALALRLWLLSSLDEPPEEALAVAERMAQVCPRCPRVAEAHLHRAEHFFSRAALDAAERAYGEVMAVPGADPMLVAYAGYKRAWTRTNLGDHLGALADFDATLERCGALGPRGHRLAREASRDQLLPMAALPMAPPEAAARLRASTPDSVERAALAARYEALLRDAGRVVEAHDFHRAWSAWRPRGNIPGPRP